MAKFNVVQKRRRAAIAERKRANQGEPFTGKLKHKPQALSVSGKRKRKLLKKWRREQKEAMEKGLVTIQDVEMAAEGKSEDDSKPPAQFHLKKSRNLKVKQLEKKGKFSGKIKGKSQKPALESAVDAMVE